MNHKYTYWIGIVIVLVLLAWGLSALAPSSEAPQEPAPDTTTSLGMLAEPNAIFVFDQKSADTLTVTSVFFDSEGAGGFIVLHTDDNGTPGKVIGTSAYIAAGESQNVSVPFTEPVADGAVVYAMLHTDDGDKTFDVQKDTPVQSSVLNGPIMGTITIDENAELPGAVMY